MKKIALVLAIASMSTSSAFAAAAPTFTFDAPHNLKGELTSFFASPFLLAKVPFLDLTGGQVAFPLPTSQSYKLTLPGFGTAAPAKTSSSLLPVFGTLDLSAQNGGKGGTFTFLESLTNKQLEP